MTTDELRGAILADIDRALSHAWVLRLSDAEKALLAAQKVFWQGADDATLQKVLDAMPHRAGPTAGAVAPEMARVQIVQAIDSVTGRWMIVPLSSSEKSALLALRMYVQGADEASMIRLASLLG